VVDAATSPLNDINLIREAIPPVLNSARDMPYGMPADLDCASTALEVQELDKALGPDLDSKAASEASNVNAMANLAQHGIDTVKDTAVGSIAAVTHNAVPFRDWVRKLTGADAYANRVTASIYAGTVRRAFIKGIRVAKECR
jgi:hypothetical protein